MNKFIFALLSLLLPAFSSNAQTPRCDTLPLAIVNSNVLFTTSDWSSFGDYMFTFYIANDHATQGFAYPQAKIDPLTPLPTGMTVSSINSTWAVFASAWNPGDVTEVKIYYDMVGSIPVDYTVSFNIWINNLQPLLSDSCAFDSLYTINLNPSTAGLITENVESRISVFPNPTNRAIHVIGTGIKNIHSIEVLNYLGEKIMTENFDAKNHIDPIRIDLENFQPGIYFLSLCEDDLHVIKKILVVK